MENQDLYGCDQVLLLSHALAPTCRSHCIMRLKISIPNLTSLSLTGTPRVPLLSPNMLLTHWERASIQLVVQVVRIATLHPVLNVKGYTSQLASAITQTSQLHPPAGTQEHPNLLLLRYVSPTTPATSSHYWVQPLCGPVGHVSSSSPRLCV